MNLYPEYRPASEDDNVPGPANKTKRGSRACDRCRKIKSKCEPSDGDSCKNCLTAGTLCTFQGPTFKRGPPKGYIHAIEQRWHQVECILATLMESPRAQGLIADLRQDPLARDVLDRVTTGPYGTSRSTRPQGITQEGIYDSIMNRAGSVSPNDDRRSRRQSRVSREIVSTQETPLGALPAREWQDQLSRRLASTSGISSPLTSLSSRPESSGSLAVSSSSLGSSGETGRRRMRMDDPLPHILNSTHRTPHHMYTMDDSSLDEMNETVSALGHLSVDENQEIRYHGRSAGLHLLAKSARNDDSQTKENGIWKFSSPRLDHPEESSAFSPDRDDGMSLPPLHVQQYLLRLYFTYVHPFFPVIHKESFLEMFDDQRHSVVNGVMPDVPEMPPRGKPMQSISRLLLLAMFAFAARYSDDNHSSSSTEGQIWMAGQNYAVDARTALGETLQSSSARTVIDIPHTDKVYHHSCTSTCQALLLIGVREFGMGSMEHGWIYTGMACRMAVDLGMNRDADHWKDAKEQYVFSSTDRQTRKQIWWSCCMADKLSAMWLGRPVMFRQGDFDAGHPEVEEAVDQELWQPYPPDILGYDFKPKPGRIMCCFQEQCKLSFLLSEIMSKIYPVKPHSDLPKRTELERLESSLHQWYFNLPDHLRYDETSKRPTPLPHVLALHIEYQCAVLLLHRAFLPNWNDPIQSTNPGQKLDPLPLKSFDICQGAAAHISHMITIYNEKYGLNRCPPLLLISLQSAGIMHVVTLNRRPGDTQGTIGLLQCIAAAHAIEVTWPSAIRIRNLLKGANVQLDNLSAWSSSSDRPKRDVEEALGVDMNSDVLQREIFSPPDISRTSVPTTRYPQNDDGPQMAAHSLGASVPGIQPSTSYLPGYGWWPQSVMDSVPHYTSEGGMYMSPYPAHGHDILNGLPPEGAFTFDENQLSSGFMQGVQHANMHMPQFHHPR